MVTKMRMRILLGLSFCAAIIGLLVGQNNLKTMICSNRVSLVFSQSAKNQSAGTWEQVYSPSKWNGGENQLDLSNICALEGADTLGVVGARMKFREGLINQDPVVTMRAVTSLAGNLSSRDTDRHTAFIYVVDANHLEMARELITRENDPQVLRAFAKTAESMGHPELTHLAYVRSGLLNPLDSAVTLEAAIWLNEKGWQADAATILIRALTLEPMNNALKLQLAHAYLGMENDQDAVAILEDLERTAPSATVYVLLGEIHLRAGKFSLAAQEFQRALGMDKKNLWAMFALGRTFESQGQVTEAKRWWYAALEQDPTFQPAKDALGIH